MEGEEKKQEEKVVEAATPKPPAAVPEAAPAAAPDATQAEQQEADEDKLILGKVLLFGKFDVSSVAVKDIGMAMYIDVSPVAVPHTGGRHTSKAFGKSKMSIVERLINNMMRTEDYTGKKIKAYRAVENAFIMIEKKTKQNPLQLFVDALVHSAPREEVTRLQYGGISVPKAVDVAPARRVDLALRYVCNGALESSHGSKKPIEECLADIIISAARGDINSPPVAKKEEIERVSSSAR